MSLSSNLEVIEELTSNAKQIQDNVLQEILKLNANTEYLHQFLHGSSDKKLFKKNVPVISYEDIKPYIDRVANGEHFNVISGKPITRFIQSSGSSGGKNKIFPVNDKFFESRSFFNDLVYLALFKHIDVIEKGKFLQFDSTKAQSITPSGISVAPLTSTYFTSDYFTNRASKRYTSPDQVILCLDSKQSLYCHLLCGLAQRDDVVRIGAFFASTVVRAITFLETYWKELCSNIRSGDISEWITDISCRDSVSIILGGPNPELADFIEQECSQKSWEGIITRLWPKTKVLQCIITGQMSRYIPFLEFYSNKLPMFSRVYASSETMFGINMNPLCKPQDVSYTFIPNISYFEFLPLDHLDHDYERDHIVDLVNVKLGCYYMPIVTNFFGLHRYKVEDIVQVTGFYNNAPQFRFVRRTNMVLSIEEEATNEEDILKAMTNASLILESSKITLMDFTCYVDVSTVPGHYVFCWELKGKNNSNNIVEHDTKILVECCCIIEESLGMDYRKFRSQQGRIGALEIKVVQRGSFNSLMEFFVSKGASTSQYKTPICINSCDAIAILENKVIASVFSDKTPSLDSS